MWRENVNAREHYLWFADNYYIAARSLVLTDQGVAAGPIAALASEQYLKLVGFELLADESKSMKGEHNVCKLFKSIEEPMRINSNQLQAYNYYEPLLETLRKAWKNKYFDDAGLMGDVHKAKGSVSVGISLSDLKLLDQLICELRKNLGISSSSLIDKLVSPFSRGVSNSQSLFLKKQNLQYENFKNRPAIIERHRRMGILTK